MTDLLHAHILGLTAPNPLLGIRVGELADEYERRDLVGLDDQRLVDSAAAIIGVPRDEVVGDRYSFVLHVPLELLARAALLPYVVPDAREGARLRIVALAAGYEASGPAAADPPRADFDSLADAAVDPHWRDRRRRPRRRRHCRRVASACACPAEPTRPAARRHRPRPARAWPGTRHHLVRRSPAPNPGVSPVRCCVIRCASSPRAPSAASACRPRTASSTCGEATPAGAARLAHRSEGDRATSLPVHRAAHAGVRVGARRLRAVPGRPCVRRARSHAVRAAPLRRARDARGTRGARALRLDALPHARGRPRCSSPTRAAIWAGVVRVAGVPGRGLGRPRARHGRELVLAVCGRGERRRSPHRLTPRSPPPRPGTPPTRPARSPRSPPRRLLADSTRTASSTRSCASTPPPPTRRSDGSTSHAAVYLNAWWCHHPDPSDRLEDRSCRPRP